MKTWCCLVVKTLFESFSEHNEADAATNCNIPLCDQYLALNLFLQIALQQGTLSHLLHAVIFLLEIWSSRSASADNR